MPNGNLKSDILSVFVDYKRGNLNIWPLHQVLSGYNQKYVDKTNAKINKCVGRYRSAFICNKQHVMVRVHGGYFWLCQYRKWDFR